jgi:outer membrane protein OmpA-like peptidoglycan-associated protein
MYQARNAIEIARSRGADRYAPEIFSKAEGSLKLAENALSTKANKKNIISLAKQTSQFSEDARAYAVDRQEAERIANERAAAAARAKGEAEAKAAVEAADAKRKADEEALRQQELAAAREAQVKAEAAAREARMKAQAEIAAAKAKAEADALRTKEEAAKAEAAQLRARLLEQFSRILETRDSPRGLVITMTDVLFDTGKYNLRPGTREQLARLSGIVVAHPGLNLDIEGYTDSTGSDEFNQKLSEQRAETVREFLIEQGLDHNTISAKGFGKDSPVASNDTSDGRQKNRRVEMIVSGEVIGQKIGR